MFCIVILNLNFKFTALTLDDVSKMKAVEVDVVVSSTGFPRCLRISPARHSMSTSPANVFRAKTLNFCRGYLVCLGRVSMNV